VSSSIQENSAVFTPIFTPPASPCSRAPLSHDGSRILPSTGKKGIDAVLYYKAMLEGVKIGVKTAEFSWMLEDNLDILKPARGVRGEGVPPVSARGAAVAA